MILNEGVDQKAKDKHIQTFFMIKVHIDGTIGYNIVA